VRAELRDFARGFLAHINGDADHAGKSRDENARHQPGGNVTGVQGMIKRSTACDRLRGMQENFRHPCHHDENENENVVPFQPASDGFEFGNLEGRQNEIFADQFFPFALEHLAIFHHHWHEKMRFQHSHPCPEGVVKPVTPAFDPEHYPNDGEIEKENDVRDLAIRKGNGDDGGATGDGPVGRDVEPLPPDHDAPELTAIEMRHGIDVARVVQAALQRNGCFVGGGGRGLFGCHGSSLNWITASPQ
jgi:hypothetical protein